MNKKQILIIAAVLLLLYWIWATKARAAAPVETPETSPDETPEAESYIVQPGDSIWKIAKKRLPLGTSNNIIYDYVVQISVDNGKNPELIDGKLQKGVNDPDLIYPGDVLTINPYTPQ